MSRSFVNFFDGAPDYRGFDEADDSFFRPSAHSTTRRVPYVGYEYVDSGFSRALAHAAGCHSSPSSHGQIPDLNSPLAFSNSRSGMISHNEIPINVVSVPTITSRDPISSTPAGKNSRIRSHLHEKAATRAPYFWRKIPIESAAPRSILQPPASVIPIDNAKPLKILNNNQSLEQRQLQLEAEIEAQWHEREALKSKMHAVKVRYNAGNARLAILAEKSMVPGCSGEAKVMLRKEFDMITVQCLKYQKEFFEMQRQIAELRTPTPVEAGISREQTPYHIPKDLLTKYEFVDAKLAAKTSLQDYTITSRSRPYGFSGNEITQVPTASSVQVVKQKNTKVSPFEAHFGRPSFCFSAKDLIAMRAANSESQSSTGYSLGNAEGTSSYHLMPMCPRALGSNRSVSPINLARSNATTASTKWYLLRLLMLKPM